VTADSVPTPFPLRMLRAAMLRADTYEEVEADKSSIWQALAVVLMAAAAAVTANLVRAATDPNAATVLPLAVQLTVVFLEPLVIWLGGSAFAYMVGYSFFRGPETESDYLEILRTTGFAFTPAILAGLAFLPPVALSLSILVVSRLWMWVACVVAVRQALDFTTGRAVGTFGVAALMLWVVLWGLSVMPIP